MTDVLPDVCIVSGGDVPRLRSPLNHKVYAAKVGFDYRLEIGPFPGLRSRFYFKLAAVRAVLGRYDWVIWLDDDAFVTDFGRNTFTEQIAAATSANKYFVIADSPVNTSGWWTKVNGGVWAIKNCAASFELLDRAMSIVPSEVLDWWRPAEHGRFCNGDQDALLWASQTGDGLSDGFKIVSHSVFNSRLYHYHTSVTDNFICHFPAVPDKRAAISEFARRFELDDTLMSAQLRAEFGVPTGVLMTPAEIRVAATRHQVNGRLHAGLAKLRTAQHKADAALAYRRLTSR